MGPIEGASADAAAHAATGDPQSGGPQGAEIGEREGTTYHRRLHVFTTFTEGARHRRDDGFGEPFTRTGTTCYEVAVPRASAFEGG